MRIASAWCAPTARSPHVQTAVMPSSVRSNRTLCSMTWGGYSSVSRAGINRGDKAMIAETRKAWVAGLCLVAMVALDSALTNLPLDGKTQGVIKIVAAVLGAVATYAVPNKPATPTKRRSTT